MGGGRPAERRFTVGGSGKSVARCHRTVLAYWKFESISLQRGGRELSVPEQGYRSAACPPLSVFGEMSSRRGGCGRHEQISSDAFIRGASQSARQTKSG